MHTGDRDRRVPIRFVAITLALSGGLLASCARGGEDEPAAPAAAAVSSEPSQVEGPALGTPPTDVLRVDLEYAVGFRSLEDIPEHAAAAVVGTVTSERRRETPQGAHDDDTTVRVLTIETQVQVAGSHVPDTFEMETLGWTSLNGAVEIPEAPLEYPRLEVGDRLLLFVAPTGAGTLGYLNDSSVYAIEAGRLEETDRRDPVSSALEGLTEQRAVELVRGLFDRA